MGGLKPFPVLIIKPMIDIKSELMRPHRAALLCDGITVSKIVQKSEKGALSVRSSFFFNPVIDAENRLMRRQYVLGARVGNRSAHMEAIELAARILHGSARESTEIAADFLKKSRGAAQGAYMRKVPAIEVPGIDGTLEKLTPVFSKGNKKPPSIEKTFEINGARHSIGIIPARSQLSWNFLITIESRLAGNA